MALFKKNDPNPLSDEDIEALLRDCEQDISDIVDAILARSEDVDIDIAELVEHLPFQARIAIVEKIRERVAEINEEKAKQLEQELQQLKQQEHEHRKGMFQRWLSHIMSQETLRKMRESFMARPGLDQAVESIGQELARKGVLQNVQMLDKAELGDLHHGVSKGQGQGKGAGRGYG